MTDSLLQMGLSNAFVSLALAIVATVVAATARRPHLAHMLWLLVFVKLVTPPIVQVPVVTIPRQPETAAATDNDSRSGQPAAAGREFDGSPVAGADEFEASRSGPPVADGGELEVDDQPDATLSARFAAVVLKHGNGWLPPTWFLGSAIVAAWSLVRVCRFSRLLAAHSEVAPRRLQVAAVKIARRLKLKAIPTICTTPARLSPMVWWTGGKVRIVIPTTLLDQMDEKQWQWILAHELAHVRRRDYLVRWIEWLACVCFWWNPVVWWAQRNLRAAEEICCDALVLSCLKPKPRTYANSLLTAVEFLASPAIRPPAMASEVNSGGFLERRFRMVVSETPNRVNSRWLQACVLLCAMAVLPFGLAVAQDFDAVERRLGEGVADGELSLEQAAAMMGALREVAEREQRDEEGEDEDREEPGEEDVSIEERLEAVGEELKAAIKAGELSEEEAWAKWAEIKKNEIAPRLKAAVKEGHMSEEEAWAIWRGIQKAEAGAKLKAAVEKGEISKEEALAKWAEINKQPGEKDERREERGDSEDRIKAVGEHLKSIGDQLKAAVAADEMSEEEAWAKWREIKEKVIKGAVAAGKLSREEAGGLWRGIEKAEAGERLKAAVEKGEISKEEALAKWAQINKQAGEGQREEKEEPGDDGDAIEGWIKSIGPRLKAAVDAGKMSEEDAWAKWFEIKEKQIAPKLKAAVKAGRLPEDRAWDIWHGLEKGEAAARLKAAVEKGEMSAEEARAKWAEINKDGDDEE